MSINEKKEFICNICGRNDFKHNMALKIHQHWHNPEYRKNISEKIKANWKNPERRSNMTKKIREVWKNPEYRKNISEKLKAKRSDPDSKYNKKKIENQPKEIQVNQPKEAVKSNKPKEVVKFVNPQIKLYFENYWKIHTYFDQNSVVKDYIRKEFNGRQIQPNIKVNIKQSVDLLIQNYLEIEKIGIYSNNIPPIYRRKRG